MKAILPLKILVTYSSSSMQAQTIIDYVSALKRYSTLDIEYLHVTHDAIINVDLQKYDAIFQNYCVRLCFEGYVSKDYIEKMRAFQGLKLITIQDDYDRTNILNQYIHYIGFDVIISAIPDHLFGYAFPTSLHKNADFYRVYTGYIPESLLENKFKYTPLEQRPIVVGYRGRNIGGRYGKLGYEKYNVGKGMQEVCIQAGIKHDINMEESGRIYGEKWFDFINDCRIMLGSESGSNVFDFDGSLEKRYDEMKKELGRDPTYQEFEPFIAEREKESNMGQIAPRHFECAVLKTPMVLFRGHYSGILEADKHYIPLEKDFSNSKEVLKKIEDFNELRAMCERVYNDVVLSNKYTYPAFARELETLIRDKFIKFNIKKRKKTAQSTLMLPIIAPIGITEEAQSLLLEEPTPHPLHQDFFVGKYSLRNQQEYDKQIESLYAIYRKNLQVNEAYLIKMDNYYKNVWSDWFKDIPKTFYSYFFHYSPQSKLQRSFEKFNQFDGLIALHRKNKKDAHSLRKEILEKGDPIFYKDFEKRREEDALNLVHKLTEDYNDCFKIYNEACLAADTQFKAVNSKNHPAFILKANLIEVLSRYTNLNTNFDHVFNILDYKLNQIERFKAQILINAHVTLLYQQTVGSIHEIKSELKTLLAKKVALEEFQSKNGDTDLNILLANYSQHERGLEESLINLEDRVKNISEDFIDVLRKERPMLYYQLKASKWMGIIRLKMTVIMQIKMRNLKRAINYLRGELKSKWNRAKLLLFWIYSTLLMFLPTTHNIKRLLVKIIMAIPGLENKVRKILKKDE